MLEAPVSGGTPRATDGTIVIMVGGDAGVFEQQLPLLKSFSGEVVHVGEIGMGSTAKLINNMLAFCNSAAAAEALMIGKRSGIDLQQAGRGDPQRQRHVGGLCETWRRRRWQGTSRRPLRSTWRTRTCAWRWKWPTNWASRA